MNEDVNAHNFPKVFTKNVREQAKQRKFEDLYVKKDEFTQLKQEMNSLHTKMDQGMNSLHTKMDKLIALVSNNGDGPSGGPGGPGPRNDRGPSSNEDHQHYQ